MEFLGKWLADLCAKAEHMIGTCGGGMDQACEILAEDGAALRIDFNPLTTRLVKLPGNALFVVLHSGDYLNKASSSQYNERVIECRVAAQFLGKFLELPNWKSMRRLREIQEKSGKTLEELLQLVKTVIPENVTAEEVIAEIGKDSLTALLTENTKHMKEFNLRPRASHCFGEAKRVNDFEEACKREDLTAMGQLMNQSHKSLQENYQNTSPGIDKLINECKKANVLGVRMTGGGWGGCLVALLDKNNPIDLSQLNVLFNSSPCQGITFEELYDQK
ncbi:unnamed protein product, partial [Mesorhabditis belari]|uniref:GHMP kinase C-terminal domain-containing protein n=1 Tax=Mesorhabditis belari TaxID=2138241 RepID=A0AAF3J677_9BILA